MSQEVQGMLIRLEATTAQMRQELARADATVAATSGNINRGLGRIDGAFGRLGLSAQAMSRMLSGAFAAVSVGSLVSQADAYANMASRLKLVTTSAQEFKEAQEAVFLIAQSSYQPLAATTELYQRIATNQKALSLTGKEVAGIVGTISKAMAVSGSSAQASEAAIIQLGQAFNTGVLRGQEFNSVMEQAPALAQAIAAGMGKNVGDLRGLAEEGKLTAEVVIKALQGQAQAVDALFAKTNTTVGNSLTAMGNSVTRFVGELDQAAQASAGMAQGILKLSTAIDQGLPQALTFARENSSALEQTLTTGLLLALGRVAGGFAQQRAQAMYAASQMRDVNKETAAFTKHAYDSAASSRADAKASLERARAGVESAKQQGAANVAAAKSELDRTKTVRAGIDAEREQAVQRKNSQLSNEGRAAAQAKIDEIDRRRVQAISQMTIAEQRLTDVRASSARQNDAATEAQTRARGVLGETTATLNSTRIASERAAGAVSVFGRAMTGVRNAASGMLGMMGGPLGLVFMVGAAALSFADFRSGADKAKEGLQNLQGPLDEVIAKFKQLTRDQQAAALVKWGEAQADATKAANDELRNLENSLKGELIGTFSRKAGGTTLFMQLRSDLESAATAGRDLSPIIEKLKDAGVSQKSIDAALKFAGAHSAMASTAREAGIRIEANRKIMEDTGKSAGVVTTATDGMTAAGKRYNDELQKKLGKVQDNNDAVKEANRYIAEHKDLSEADKKAILSSAYAIEAQEKANKANAKAVRDSNKAYQENSGQKMLDDAKQRYAVLLEQKDAIEEQGDGVRTLGAEAKKLIQLEQEIAQLKEKKTLTAAQKQVLAMADLNIAQQKQNAELEKANALTKIQSENKAKLVAFQEQLNEQLQLAKEGLDVEVAGIGMGQKQRQRLQEDLRIRGDYQKQLAKLQRDYQNIVNPTAEQNDLYEQETKAVREALAERLRYQEDYYRQLDDAQSNWANGANAAWQDYIDSASDIAGQTYDVFSNAFHGLEDVLVDFAMTGKLTFKDFANSVIADIARIIVRTQIVTPLLNALFSGGGGATGGGLLSGAASLLGGPGSGGGSSSGGGLWSGALGLGKNLVSAWNTITGVGSAASAGFASGGIGGAISGIGGYYGSMISSGLSTLSGGISSLATALGLNSVATAAAATTVEGAFAAGVAQMGLSATATTAAATTVEGAFAAGVSQLGTQMTLSSGMPLGAAGAGVAAQSGLSAALSSAAAMWPLAVIMGMYQSGKLYDAGVRPSGSEMMDNGGGTIAGKAAVAPIAIQSSIMELTDKINGSLIGGKMAAIISGSTVHQAVWGAVAKKLFGTGYQTKDSGISLSVDDGEFDAQSFVKQKKKGGLLSGSSKTRFLYNDLDKELADPLGQAYNERIIGSLGLFSTLGVTLADTVLDNFNVAAAHISTQGRAEEDIKNDIDAWFASMSDVAVAAINEATNAGLGGYTYEGLTAFVNNLYGVNNALKHINVGLFGMSVTGGYQAEQLAAWAGGFDKLQESIAGYYDMAFTEAEKAANVMTDVRDAFKASNLVLPESRDGFRDLVEGIDKSTEAGRQMFLTLMSLAPAADAAFDILESRQQTYNQAFLSEAENAALAMAAVRDEFKEAGIALPATRSAFRAVVDGIDVTTEAGRKLKEQMIALAGSADTLYTAQQSVMQSQLEVLNNAVSASMSTVQRAVSAEKSAITAAYNARTASLNDMVSTAQESISGLTSITNALDSALKALRGTSDDAVKMMRDQAKATLNSALSIARAGGSLSGFEGLEDALGVISDNDTSMYASLIDFNREQGRNANLVAELNGITGKQLTADQQLLKMVQNQIKDAKTQYDDEMARLDSQLELAQAQIDALNGIDNSVLSVRDAMAQLSAAVSAAAAANAAATPAIGGGYVGTGTAGAPSASDLNSVYQQVLGRDADVAGASYWAGQLGSGAVTDLAAAIRADAIKNGEIPAFATGGFHAGGMRLVGENGPELEVTGPSRIFNASQTAEMLRGIGETGPVLQITRPSQIYSRPAEGQGGRNGDAALIEELRQLRADIHNDLRQIAKYTEQTASSTRSMKDGGVEISGTVMTQAVDA